MKVDIFAVMPNHIHAIIVIDHQDGSTDGVNLNTAFDEDGNILYDKVNGVLKMVDDKTYNYSEEELASKKTEAESILASISKGNYSAFEAKAESMIVPVLDMDNSSISDYYVSDIDQASYVGQYAYMNEIYLALKDMGEGEIRMVETEYGFHIIMKYGIEDGAFSDSANDIWFENFMPALVTELFRNKCDSILPNIQVNEENLKGAKSITEIGINYDYCK